VRGVTAPQAAVGPEMEMDDDVVVGYPAARGTAAPVVIGRGARLRRGTVLYQGSRIGARLATGHGVTIREECTLGDDVSVWTNSVIDYGCRIGDRVKIHSNCYVAQFTVIEDDVFLAPGVVIANDLYPGYTSSADAMAGPYIEARAQIGVNTTVLPYVRLGADAIIGAGSVVTKDIPPRAIAYGNPAVVARGRDDLGDVDDLIRTRAVHVTWRADPDDPITTPAIR
jgi:acetyltransferase-like isoleucine patch superfamily enzyme